LESFFFSFSNNSFNLKVRLHAIYGSLYLLSGVHILWPNVVIVMSLQPIEIDSSIRKKVKISLAHRKYDLVSSFDRFVS